MQATKIENCKACNGKGMYGDTEVPQMTGLICNECNGTGKIEVSVIGSPERIELIQSLHEKLVKQ